MGIHVVATSGPCSPPKPHIFEVFRLLSGTWDHLEERLLDQAQALALYIPPPFLGVVRVAAANFFEGP